MPRYGFRSCSPYLVSVLIVFLSWQQEVLKYTDTTHADYANLTQASSGLHDIAKASEQRARDQEVRDEMVAIAEKWADADEVDTPIVAPGRRLVRQLAVTQLNFSKTTKKKVCASHACATGEMKTNSPPLSACRLCL